MTPFAIPAVAAQGLANSVLGACRSGVLGGEHESRKPLPRRLVLVLGGHATSDEADCRSQRQSGGAFRASGEIEGSAHLGGVDPLMCLRGGLLVRLARPLREGVHFAGLARRTGVHSITRPEEVSIHPKSMMVLAAYPPPACRSATGALPCAEEPRGSYETNAKEQTVYQSWPATRSDAWANHP